MTRNNDLTPRIEASALAKEERAKWKAKPQVGTVTPNAENQHCSEDATALPWSVLRVTDNQRFLVHRLALIVPDDTARGELTHDELKQRFPDGLHFRHVLGLAVGEAGWLRTGGVTSAGVDLYMAVYID